MESRVDLAILAVNSLESGVGNQNEVKISATRTEKGIYSRRHLIACSASMCVELARIVIGIVHLYNAVEYIAHTEKASVLPPQQRIHDSGGR